MGFAADAPRDRRVTERTTIHPPAATIAAGTVVIRKDRVLLVHRPKYDDWSFPKGKQDPGEPEVVTAVRETLEETGVEVRLGRPLPSQSYLLRDGTTKVVHYWRGEIVGDPDVSRYQPNREIDHVAWVPLDRAVRLLTYTRDRSTLDDARRHPKPTVPLVVLRHAKATSRRRWEGEDCARPLTEAGQQQARELCDLRAAYGITRVVSSTSTRCLQTVQPYAHEHVLEVAGTDLLTEEHQLNPDQAVGLIEDLLLDPEPTVVCTHRPLLPDLLEHLGLEVNPLSPAAMVVVHHRKRKIRAAELLETRTAPDHP